MTPPPCKGVYGFYVTNVVTGLTVKLIAAGVGQPRRSQDEYARLAIMLKSLGW